jgi:hypothetical protein
MAKKKQPRRTASERPAQQLDKSKSQDVPDPEKKSSRHKKVTADKWNQ